MKRVIKYTEAFYKLRTYKEEDDQSSFNLYFQDILPEFENYLDRKLKDAVQRKSIPQGKYKVADFIDDLYIKAYEHILTIEEGEFFKIWLYRTLDQLLEDIMIEEEFDDYFIQNIEELTQDEWKEMEENYTIDGGGDFVMEEELNDLSYNHNDYILKDIFVDKTEESHIIEELDSSLKSEKINQHIKIIISKMPYKLASVLELFSRQKLKSEEIAKVKNMTINEVEGYLSKARKMIKASLRNRFKG